jgi:prepilin-type N-terminal cleavage/methylation domain-containing protein
MRSVHMSRRAHGDRGVTLVETLIVMILLAIVSTLVTRAVIDSHKVVRIVDDQTQGLADVRVASERLGRDIREARSVVCNPSGTPPALVTADPSCQYHLQLWIDYNSDYAQQTDETVTWSLDDSSRPGQYDLVRTVGSATGVVQARTIVVQVAFSYDVAPSPAAPPPGAPHTSVVRVNMTYDSNLRSGTQNKTVSFTGRLRNVS